MCLRVRRGLVGQLFSFFFIMQFLSMKPLSASRVKHYSPSHHPYQQQTVLKSVAVRPEISRQIPFCPLFSSIDLLDFFLSFKNVKCGLVRK